MKLDVVIPTYLREEKLARALSSIHGALDCLPADVFAKVRVFYSSQAEKAAAEKAFDYPWLEILLYEEKDFSLPRFWNHALRTSPGEAMCYLTDDVLLNRWCLAIACMEIKKMDFDGVVGFAIENITEPHQPCLAAFGVIGAKYADRFENRQVFCPEYRSLFADTELQRQAEILGRFRFHKACSLVHYHPAYTPEEADATHAHTRREFESDRKTFEKRTAQDLVWGISDELVRERR